jgi:hypothetical protein
LSGAVPPSDPRERAFAAVQEPAPIAVRPTVEERPDGGPETCATCRMPVGPTQRYCLHCGARRAGIRLEFLDVLDDDRRRVAAAPATAGGPAAAATAPDDAGVRSWPFGLTAVVLLALLVGLLAGRWVADARRGETTATQVIRVEGAGGSAAGTPAVAATGGAASGSAAATGSSTRKGRAASTASKPPKITRKVEQDVLNDTSGTSNLAPKDANPNGANFDAIP